MRAVAVATLAAVALAPAAHGQELFGGYLAHDADLHIADCCYEGGADFEFGLRSGPLVTAGRYGSLRVYAFGSVNSDDGVDFGAAGLAWRFPLPARLYLQPGLGGAWQDGPLEKYQASPDRLYLGSRWLFEPELSLGYRLSPRLAAEVAYVHLSHARLAGPQNPGMDDLGVRLAWRFGR